MRASLKLALIMAGAGLALAAANASGGGADPAAVTHTAAVAATPLPMMAKRMPRPVDTIDEMTARQDVVDQARMLVEKRDYAGLNTLEAQLRTGARTPSGTWKLGNFYGGIHPVAFGTPVEQCARIPENFFAEWRKFDPAQPGAYVAEAQDLHRYGSCLRGGKAAADTPREALRAFFDFSVQATALLEAHREVASIDPQFHVVLIDSAIALGVDHARMQALLDEATAAAPDFPDIYFAASGYYHPHWFGRPGDMEHLARYAAGRTRADRDGIYARIYWNYSSLLCDCDSVRSDLDWPTAKQSMLAVLRAYPDNWNVANFARLACNAGDLEAADQFVDRLTKLEGEWATMPGFANCLDAVQTHRDRLLAVAYAAAPRFPARCPYAAIERWSREDLDRNCKGLH